MAAILKIMCWMKEKRSTDAAVKPKLKRKFSLGEVTQQSSNSSVERYYNQLVKQLKKLERDGKRLDVMSDAYDEVKKLEAKVRQEIDRLTSDKDKIIQKLINKKNKEEENAWKHFLRQQINQLRSKRDFNEFCVKHDVSDSH